MPRRSRILWLGPAGPAELQLLCESRGLELTPAQLPLRSPDLAPARAVVLSEPQDELLRPPIRVFEDALAHGLQVFILAKAGRVGQIRSGLEGQEYFHRIQVSVPDRAASLAEAIARHEPGPIYAAVGQLEIVGLGNVNAEDDILLRRAFSDCTKLTLKRMTTGSAAVYQGFATLRESRAGPLPLPFFVKLDRSSKVRREIGNYEDCTALFVPFDARPNAVPQRCLVGANRGVIVGNFVERAEPLIDVVQRGVAAIPEIDSLFRHALRGWRAQPDWRGPSTVPPPEIMEPRGAIRTWSADHLRRASQCAERARRDHGLTMSAEEIGDILDGLPAIPHHRVMCHGDLHGENVTVVNGRAVLIDFAAVDKGPLARDPATLETSLMLKCSADPAVWTRVATAIYAPTSVFTMPPQAGPTQELSGICNVIRQIRHYGLSEQITDGEYAQAVATQLLRHSLRRDPGEQEHRRPLFLALAAELARRLQQLRLPRAQTPV